ncbi:MAG: DUF1294 domain-containing protein [Clostridia bacterium]|nr:DUF1294 domain-containing protein [Clostridia bacterium]
MILKATLIYLAVISLISALITVHDKRAAKRSKRRVPERTLIIFSLIGGSVAMYMTMQLIRHKTRHAKFMIGIPVIIVLQLAAVIATARLLM